MDGTIVAMRAGRTFYDHRYIESTYAWLLLTHMQQRICIPIHS